MPERGARVRATRLTLDGGLVADVVDMPARSAASEHAPAYLLLHGIGMTSASLEPLARALAETRRAVCVTLPGHGSTPRPAVPLDVEGYARVAGAVAGRLGLSSVVAIGQSMGTQMSVELARQRPALVAGVVLIGPVVDDARPTAVRQAAVLAADSLVERPLTNAIVLRDYVRCGARWYAGALGPMLGYPTRSSAAEIDVPALIVRGSHDPIARADWCVRLAAGMRDARVATLPGPHHVQMTRPVDVARLVSTFVRERVTAPSRADDR